MYSLQLQYYVNRNFIVIESELNLFFYKLKKTIVQPFFFFSRAQFAENRSIFNTPNPRLMNVSLLKDSKFQRSSMPKRANSTNAMRNSSLTYSNSGIPGADRTKNRVTLHNEISRQHMLNVRLLCTASGVLGF